ncbi:MAG: NAD-dependent epimerase/dehydratase family protein [Burkholderiales bacterium]
MNQKGLILVTGATGFVGAGIVPALIAAGWRVRACGRNIERSPKECEFVRCDIAEENDFASLVRGTDAILHLAARVHVMRETASDPLAEFRRANVDPTARLAKAAVNHGVKHFIYASSLKVHGEKSGDRPLRELDPLCSDDAYGKSKIEAEKTLREVASPSAMRSTIFRLPLMYGPGVRGNFHRLARLIARGVPLPFSLAANRRSMLYLGNFCSATLAALHRNITGHETFLLSDDHDVSTAELVTSIAMAMGRPARLFPAPISLLRLAAMLGGFGGEIRRLTDSLQVDIGHIRDVLAWSPPHNFDEGIRQTILAMPELSFGKDSA